MVKEQDRAMWSTLSGRALGTIGKLIFVIALVNEQSQQAMGQTALFIDPGFEADNCTDKWINQLKEKIEEHNPTTIYAHVEFKSDNSESAKYRELIGFLEAEKDRGRTCILADTRNTTRWDIQEECGHDYETLVKCRGDLAFRINDKDILNELDEWARERDNGNPRCTDDLSENQFADILSGIAEAKHLDKCVDATFVGTEEAKAEEDPVKAIDGI